MTTPGAGRGRRELAYLALLILLLAAYALPIALHRAGRVSLAESLLLEDGLYEWTGALACLAGGLLFLFAWRSRRQAWALLFGLFLLAVCAEELRWGQHLFGFELPDWFEEHNHQGNLTIHNLDLLGETNNAASDIGIDLLQMYLLALPLLLAAFPTLGRLARRVGLPVPALAVAFIAGVLKYLNREAEQRFGHAADVSNRIAFGEIFETSLELLLLAVAVECWLASRTARNGADPPGERVPAGPGGG